MRRGVLILSASMGAGHDGAANELRRRLEARGHRAEVRDFLTMAPFDIGGLVRWMYQLQLRFAPWTYELSYKYLLPALYWPVVLIDSWFTRVRLRRVIEQFDPDVIVCTYGLPALVLGRWRKKGLLRIPVVTFCTDFSVHQMWVHHSVDLHLTVSPRSAELAQRHSDGECRAPGPLVREAFRVDRPDRDEARRWLNLAPTDRTVLVVAGSWGVGEVSDTVKAIAAAGDFHPITVCGRDEELKRDLDELGIGTVVGWTDQMPKLMAAADALVENAGGLTCMEAFAFGVPVVTYRPIPGHGRDNAQTMTGAGVNRYVHDDDELATALAEVTAPGIARQRLLYNASALFASDPSDDVLETAAQADFVPAPLRVRKSPRRVASVAASLALVYGGLTVGAQAVAARGVGVARAPRGATGAAYIGVRVDRTELHDPALVAALKTSGVTVIVDGRTAQDCGHQLERLAGAGVDIGNGGWGKGRPLRWQRARNDVEHSANVISKQAGVAAHEFVPERRLDAFDQFYSRRKKQKLVKADHTFTPTNVPATIADRGVYLLDARKSDPGVVQVAISALAERVGVAGLHEQPLEVLR
jgi:processive 1,2-diacylglycerol beta-glucosyltransferase